MSKSARKFNERKLITIEECDETLAVDNHGQPIMNSFASADKSREQVQHQTQSLMSQHLARANKIRFKLNKEVSFKKSSSSDDKCAPE